MRHWTVIRSCGMLLVTAMFVYACAHQPGSFQIRIPQKKDHLASMLTKADPFTLN